MATLFQIKPLEIHKGILCLVPSVGLCQVHEQKLYSIDPQDDKPIATIPEKTDDIIAVGEKIFAKTDNLVYSCTSTAQKVITLENPNFRIFPSVTDGFFIVIYNQKGSQVFKCNDSEHTIQLITQMPARVIHISEQSPVLMTVVTRSDVYLHQDNKWKKLLAFFEPITDAALTGAGIVFTTKKGMYLIPQCDHVRPIIQSGCRQLLSACGDLYAIDDDIWKIKWEVEDLFKPDENIKGLEQYI